MFGDVTFAQAPFAALGGGTFATAIIETATATAVSTQETTAGSLMQESVTALAVVVNSNNILRPSVAETAAATATQVVIANMLAAQAETSTASAAQTNIATMLATQTETVSALDEPSTTAVLLGFVAEAVTATDASVGGKLWVVAIDESATGSDTQTARVIFTGTVSELVQASATVSTIRTVNANVTGIQLYVRIGDVLIWTVIDDNQTPNWQNIDNTQGSGWVSIANSQTPGWDDIPS